MLKRTFQSGLAQVLVLSASLAYAGSIWLAGHFVLGWQYGIAIALLVLCWSVRALAPRSFWLVVLFTLLAAMLNIAMFLPGSAWAMFGIGPLKIGFHPLFGPLFVISLWFWRDRFRSWLNGPPSSADELERVRRSRIDSYKRNLAPLTTADLQAKLRDPQSLVPEAMRAAQELLTERGTN
jgi:hypothetical protein